MILSWGPDRIRYLRLRLGWSQAELARQLKCKVSQIADWEKVGIEQRGFHSNLLEQLLSLVDQYSEQIEVHPVADSLMRDQGLSQVSAVAVRESIDRSTDRSNQGK